MARVVAPKTYGSPDVLTVRDVGVPHAGNGEVVVRLRAIGVNPLDWKTYSGSFHEVDEEHSDTVGSAKQMPRLGLEGSGVVTEIGDGVAAVSVGDEVIVYPVPGTYADYVTAPTSSIIQKPAGLGWAEAAGLILAGATAAHAVDAAGVGSEDTVVVHGGSGSVGLVVIQLAAARGARVIATASPRNHDLLRRLGATPVAYGDGLLCRLRDVAPYGVDAAIDTVGTQEALDSSLKLVEDRNRIVSITGSDRRAAAGIKRLGYGPGEDAGHALRSAARTVLAAQAATGDLEIVIAATFPLDQAAAAHRLGIAGHRPGKLILTT